MLVRPPGPRNPRKTGRRGMPQSTPDADGNRPLMRLYIRNRWPSPQRRAYNLSVREGPQLSANGNASGPKPVPHPWLSVKDTVYDNRAISFPVSICEALVKHLITCEEVKTGNLSSASAEPENQSDSNEAVPHTTTTPTQGSGDGHSQDENVHSTKMEKSNTGKRTVFNLDLLGPLRIMCEATNSVVEITAKDPHPQSAEKEDGDQTATKPRRWLISSPNSPNGTVSSTVGEESDLADNELKPWEKSGFIELHDTLMAQFCGFLMDVSTRYRAVETFPEVPSLYSASGGRRFYFDLRDTPWGKRVHISQVTDQRRATIGIPLEDVVNFRDRLDSVILQLNLEDQFDLRMKLNARPTGQPRGGSRRRNTQEGRDVAPAANDQQPKQGQRDNRRRRRRQRVFTNTTKKGLSTEPRDSSKSGSGKRTTSNSQQSDTQERPQVNGSATTSPLSDSPKESAVLSEANTNILASVQTVAETTA